MVTEGESGFRFSPQSKRLLVGARFSPRSKPFRLSRWLQRRERLWLHPQGLPSKCCRGKRQAEPSIATPADRNNSGPSTNRFMAFNLNDSSSTSPDDRKAQERLTLQYLCNEVSVVDILPTGLMKSSGNITTGWRLVKTKRNILQSW